MNKDQSITTKNQPRDNSSLFTSLTDFTIEKISGGGDKNHQGWCDLASFSQANSIPEVREFSW